MARYEFNDEHNGIEIYFDSVPSDEIRARLRENGWRWFRAKKCWYTRRSDVAIALAEEICSGASIPVVSATTKTATDTASVDSVVFYVMPEMTQRCKVSYSVI